MMLVGSFSSLLIDRLRIVIIFASASGGFIFFVVILVALVLLFAFKRRQMRRNIDRLVDERTTSYGSLSQSFAQSYRHNQYFSNLGKLLLNFDSIALL